MAEIFDDATELPTSAPHGKTVGIRIPDGMVEHMVWDEDEQVWIGRQHWTMRVMQSEGFTAYGAPSNWRYPAAFGESPPSRVHPTAQQFMIHKALSGGQFWAAGLRLQEHLSGEIKPTALGGTTTELPEVALAWYPLAHGDDFLSPASFNHGVRLFGDRDTSVYKFQSSGWQNNELETEPAFNDHLYPEIYVRGPIFNMRGFNARHRWVAGDFDHGPENGERPSDYPGTEILQWYKALDIPVADGQPIAEWGDYSGRGGTLKQATSGKRPIVKADPSGFRYVEFDGTNDSLAVAASPSLPSVAHPITVFMVMRQRAGGPAQQVWFGLNASGAPLIYRGDSTDQVNVWAGGSDVIYHRSSAWPSPWMVWSITMNSPNASIWEGLTEVYDGGGLGSNGLNGLVVGSNQAETLPARLDLAEMIVSYRAWGDSERTALVNKLIAEYGI